MKVIMGNGFGFTRDSLIDVIEIIERFPEMFNKKYTYQAEKELGMCITEILPLKSWMLAMGLIEKYSGIHRLTKLGKIIKQYDPYLKDIGTWWVLHINLSMLKSNSSLWHFYSNSIYSEKRFSTDNLIDFMFNKFPLYSKVSVTKGVKCMVKIMLGNPFTKLGLMVDRGDGMISRSKVSGFDQLHPTIAAYALVKRSFDYNNDFLTPWELEKGTDNFSRILFLLPNQKDDYINVIVNRFDHKILRIRSYGENENSYEIVMKDPDKLLELYYMETIRKANISQLIKAIG